MTPKNCAHIFTTAIRFRYKNRSSLASGRTAIAIIRQKDKNMPSVGRRLKMRA